MALNLITAPASVPTAVADYAAQNNLIAALLRETSKPLQVISGNIPEGAVIYVGGAVYEADSDTSIGGMASDYVKITPSGTTASASYVTDLTGVTWSKDYNGYYDVNGNLYIFNENKALFEGEIATIQSKYLGIDETGNIDGNLIIGTGSADRNIQFATDANILWDESEDKFIFDKNIFVTGSHYIRGRKYSNSIHDASMTSHDAWVNMQAFISTVGNKMAVSGGVANSTGSIPTSISKAERISATVITVYGIRMDTGELHDFDFTYNDTTTLYSISLAW